jgi:hypothetical protein
MGMSDFYAGRDEAESAATIHHPARCATWVFRGGTATMLT